MTVALVWAFLRPGVSWFLKPPGIYIALVLAALLAIWVYGAREYGRGYDDADMVATGRAAALVLAAKETAARDAVRRAAATHNFDLSDAYQRGRADGAHAALPNLVRIYVNPDFGALCAPNGVVRLLDASGLGTDPDSLPRAPGERDADCSGVSLSKAIKLLADNAINAADDRARLADIKRWADAQQALNPAPAGP